VAQWTWNLRLELGHKLVPEALRTTEFAPALPEQNEHEPPPPTSLAATTPADVRMLHLPLRRPGKLVASLGPTFPFNPMGRFGVPQATHWSRMNAEERADGSLRVVYGASIRSCRPCPLREQCQWGGSTTAKPTPA